MAEDFSDKNKDYGLPKVEPQPIRRDQPGIPKPPPVNKVNRPPKKDNRLIIVVLSIVGALILASLLYILFWEDGSPYDTQVVPEVEDRVVVDPEPEGSGDQDAETEPVDNSVVTEEISDEPGSIVTISARTNRYYIFVGSYKFRAYAKRHAEKLAADGFAVKLITPDNWVGVRVAVGNYATKEEAGADAQQIRSRYGIEVVISKY